VVNPVTGMLIAKMPGVIFSLFNVMLVIKKWQVVAAMPAKKQFTCPSNGSNN
jgi:hypothetical protein